MERQDEPITGNVAVSRYIEEHGDDFLAELRGFCRIPSVTGNREALDQAARRVAELLRGIGAEVRLVRNSGRPPVVCGEVGEGDMTLLVYNHYDVQPPEPLEKWERDPFSAETAEGRLYARGASDNKGNLTARIQAVRAYRDCIGPLPLKVKFIVEGEEESGSENLGAFVAEHGEFLRADGCLWEGSWKDTRERPIISCGVKGLCHVELVARGASHDMHSSFAGIVPNPAWRLVRALAALRDADDRIAVPGMEDEAEAYRKAMRESLRGVSFDEESFKAEHGLESFVRGETGAHLVETLLCGTTCTICGLRAGHTGEGMKTVLPAEATAKLDFRLVPGMTPESVLRRLRGHLDERGFRDVEVKSLGGLMPFATDPGDGIVASAAEAIREVCGAEPVLYPVAPWGGPLHQICGTLEIPTVAFGISYAGSLDHAPNENIRLTDYFEGIRVMMEFMRIYKNRAEMLHPTGCE